MRGRGKEREIERERQRGERGGRGRGVEGEGKGEGARKGQTTRVITLRLTSPPLAARSESQPSLWCAFIIEDMLQ